MQFRLCKIVTRKQRRLCLIPKIVMVWNELAVCYLGLGDDATPMELFRRAERLNYEVGVIHNYQVVLANTAIAYYSEPSPWQARLRAPFRSRSGRAISTWPRRGSGSL